MTGSTHTYLTFEPAPFPRLGQLQYWSRFLLLRVGAGAEGQEGLSKDRGALKGWREVSRAPVNRDMEVRETHEQVQRQSPGGMCSETSESNRQAAEQLREGTAQAAGGGP